MNSIDELTHRSLNGTLSAEDALLLTRLVTEDAQAAERHFQILRLEAVLRGLGRAPDVLQPTIDHVQQAGREDLERSVMRAIGQLPNLPWAGCDERAAVGRWSGPARHPRRWALTLAISVSLVLFFWWPQPKAREASLLELLSSTDRVEVLDASQNPLPVAPRRTIVSGQTVVAYEDDFAQLAYADGTKVEIYGPSRLEIYSGPEGDKRLKLIAGGMRLDVRPQPANRPMLVSTPQGEIRVLGTRFRLTASDDRTRLEMEEGRVAFSHADGRTVEVSRGAYVVAEESLDPVAVQPLPPTLVAPLWSRLKVTGALAMSAGGDVVAVGSRSEGVLLLDVATGELREEIRREQITGESSSKLLRLAFADQDQQLVGITEHGSVIRLSLPGAQAELLDSWGATFALRLLSPDGALLGRTVGGGWQPKVRIWRLPPGRSLEHLRDIGGENDTWSAAFSADGSIVAYGTRIGRVHVEEVESGRELWRQQMGTNNIRQLGLSPDGKWLAAYSPGLGIQLWSLENSAVAATWLPEGPAARSLVFSPDSRQLAAGLADRTVRFWSIPDGRPTLLIETSRGGGEQIVFSPDGRRLATAGHDTVALWELP